MLHQLSAGAMAAAVLLLLVACGSESEQPRKADSGADELLSHVLSGTSDITVMDMAAAKRQLGVAADLDPNDHRRRSSASNRGGTFDDAAFEVMGYISADPTPMAHAIDHGAITVAALAFMPGSGGNLNLYRTSQPKDAIKADLAKARLKSVGKDVYALEDPGLEDEVDTVGLGDDGLVIMAESAEIVTAALHRTEPDTRVAPMLRILAMPRGALRAVHNYVELPEEKAPCLRYAAGGQLFGPGQADEDLVLEMSGEPRSTSVVLGSRATQRKDFRYENYTLTGVSRERQILRLKVRTEPGALDSENAATIAHDSYNANLVYRCPRT